MLLRLENAAASMDAMRRQQERVSNNLANANTSGYKRDRLFTEALNERLDNEGAPRSDRRFTQGSDFSAGALREMGNPLDVALGGGASSSRAARAEGSALPARTTSWWGRTARCARRAVGAVQGEGGSPIQIPTDFGGAVEIAKNGEIAVGGQRVGKLLVVQFDDTQALERADQAAARRAIP